MIFLAALPILAALAVFCERGIWYEPDMAERGEVEVLAIRVGTGEAPPPAYQSAGAAGMDLPADEELEGVGESFKAISEKLASRSLGRLMAATPGR